MTRKKPELPEGDDGRTIVDMNVEGMPWYSPRGRMSEGNVGDSPVVPPGGVTTGRVPLFLETPLFRKDIWSSG